MKIFSLNSIKPAFTGRVWFDYNFKHKNNEALNEFGDYIRTQTLQGLDIYIRNMPPREAKEVAITNSYGQPDTVRENVKIIYESTDKTLSRVITGFYLNEKESKEAQLQQLKKHLQRFSPRDML